MELAYSHLLVCYKFNMLVSCVQILHRVYYLLSRLLHPNYKILPNVLALTPNISAISFFFFPEPRRLMARFR